MASQSVESGVYFIQNIGTSTVLDLTGGHSADGTKVQGYVKRALGDPLVPAQLWIIFAVGGGQYTVENVNSRTFLDLTGSNIANGTPLIGYQAMSNPNQRWIFTRNTANTAYVIANGATGTYVDLYNGGSSNGTAVNGWEGSGPTTTNPNQQWTLIRA